MNENNKSSCSSQTNRENFFLSQVHVTNKRPLNEKFLTPQNSAVQQIPKNFITFKTIDDEGKKYMESKNKILKKRNFFSDEKNLKAPFIKRKMNVPSLSNFDLSQITKLEEEPETHKQNHETASRNVIFKYVNFNTPKNLAESNESLKVYHYDYEKNPSFIKFWRNSVLKWKNQHQMYILQGLLNKKIIPILPRDEESQKTELVPKKIELSGDLLFRDEKLSKFSRIERKKSMEARKPVKKMKIPFYDQPSINFKGVKIPLNLSNSPVKQREWGVTESKKPEKLKCFLPKIQKIKNKKSEGENVLDGILSIK